MERSILFTLIRLKARGGWELLGLVSQRNMDSDDVAHAQHLVQVITEFHAKLFHVRHFLAIEVQQAAVPGLQCTQRTSIPYMCEHSRRTLAEALQKVLQGPCYMYTIA